MNWPEAIFYSVLVIMSPVLIGLFLFLCFIVLAAIAETVDAYKKGEFNKKP